MQAHKPKRGPQGASPSIIATNLGARPIIILEYAVYSVLVYHSSHQNNMLSLRIWIFSYLLAEKCRAATDNILPINVRNVHADIYSKKVIEYFYSKSLALKFCRVAEF